MRWCLALETDANGWASINAERCPACDLGHPKAGGQRDAAMMPPSGAPPDNRGAYSRRRQSPSKILQRKRAVGTETRRVFCAANSELNDTNANRSENKAMQGIKILASHTAEWKI